MTTMAKTTAAEARRATSAGRRGSSAKAAGRTSAAKPTQKASSQRRAAAARPRARGGAAPAPKPAYRSAILGGVAVALAAAFHVWTGLQVAELGYERSQWIKINRALETQREEAADELESLLRTDYLEAEAERRLGLLPPAAGQVVDLRAQQLARTTRRAR